MYSGSLETSAAELQSSVYSSQMLGMAAQGTTYTSNIPSTKEGIVKELGQRAVVAELAKATGIDPATEGRPAGIHR